jgi:hypothetical protein
MYTTQQEISKAARLKQGLGRILHLLGSLKLAVMLLALVAAVIGAATIIETDYGRDHALWYVYRSKWFVVLLAMLGINIFCAALSRWPWKRQQTGFVVTHGGLLVLLFGSILSFVGGIEGQVTLTEGEATSKMTISQQSLLSASWVGQPEEAPYEFSFDPGPVDWSVGTTLDVGKIDGLGARVLHYYRHAKATEEWIADESGAGGPAVKVKVEGPHISAPVEYIVVDQGDGGEALVGPVRVQLQRATADAMLDTFLHPPTDNLGKKGLLLVYFKNQTERIAVDQSIGKKVPLGNTGVSVEIAEYLANARPDAHGNFHSVNAHPRNPLLELRVYLPDRKQPIRQLAFAKRPLLNLDAVYGEVCPVTFRYHHPAVHPSKAIEFLQTSGEKLYCRVTGATGIEQKGQVQAGSAIQMGENFTFSIVEYLPHARQKVVFEPADMDGDQKEKPEAAAEVEVSAGGLTQTLWLQRNHPAYGARILVTPKGMLRVSFGSGKAPLGFVLHLVDFHHDTNPGGVGNATYSSVVRVIDKHAGVDEEHDISMNEPLTYNRLTFYQSSFDDAAHGRQSSTFSVVYDPGRILKYAGSLMICLGIAIMFYMRAYFFKSVPRLWGKRLATSAAESSSSGETAGRESGLALQAVLESDENGAVSCTPATAVAGNLIPEQSSDNAG